MAKKKQPNAASGSRSTANEKKRPPLLLLIPSAAFGVLLAVGYYYYYYYYHHHHTRETRWSIACRSDSSCGRQRSCDRVLIPGFASRGETEALKRIAVKGMTAASANASSGGPTIFDINSGYVLAPGARLANLHQSQPGLFEAAEYELYRAVIKRLKRQVEKSFKAEVYFTAPTFITRLSGLNASWEPEADHDEYWQGHVDRDNTAHYEYSGLLYLSDYGLDFTGGEFEFVGSPVIEPRAGKLLLFASSEENPHRVRQVEGGERFVLSFWFTCDAKFEFADFLDGKSHLRYGGQEESSPS